MPKYLIVKRNNRTIKLENARPMHCLIPMSRIEGGMSTVIIDEQIASQYLRVLVNGNANICPEDIIHEFEE